MRREENRSTRRKTSQSKGELNLIIMSTLGFEPLAILVGDECSHHCTTLLLNMYEYEENQKKRLLKNVNNNNVHTYV